MSSGEGNLLPGRAPRSRYRDPLSSATPVPHVDLGRLRSKARTGGRLHIVTLDGETWRAACTGSEAVRAFPGRAEQAECGACKRAVR